ncbi:uncharacterized protein BO72DRAFT_134423 [Aspergillus fijiensis CBS 313.89]|uniref:Secreted protein n=1 Tax=Aspergillus fijiensis CBS 313.89 TaxID=1448319 RepID=A0A8G1RR61_9EURO|nr:uncharacterized protein BO72DRAFT_134423 [Aspergillus fijiensis CBS 313.89]RAK76420.1 hypothetical protein BO72DRAFT_134423 [Aspergillus fijiensis CBS 313.89]
MHKKHCALVLLDLGFGIFIQGKGICGRSTRDEQQQQSGNYSSGTMIPSRCTCRIGAGLSVWKGSPSSGSILVCHFGEGSCSALPQKRRGVRIVV